MNLKILRSYFKLLVSLGWPNLAAKRLINYEQNAEVFLDGILNES